LFLFSDIYYFRLPVFSTLLQWEYMAGARAFSFRNHFISHFYRMYFHGISRLFSSFTKVFFLKLSIRGKGYYIYKDSRRTVTHQFGHSHRTYIPTCFVLVKFLTKKSVIIFGSSKKDVVKVGQRIRRSKYMNVFTGRGVRFNRQPVYRKTGKVSAYR
jgi:ribosomal protein L6P/L9E